MIWGTTSNGRQRLICLPTEDIDVTQIDLEIPEDHVAILEDVYRAVENLGTLKETLEPLDRKLFRNGLELLLGDLRIQGKSLLTWDRSPRDEWQCA